MGDTKLEIILSAKDASAAAFAQVTGRLKDLGGAVFSLKGAIAGLGVGIGITSFAKSILDTAASFEQLQLKLDTVSKGKGKETLALIDETVRDLPVDVAKATDAWVMMGAMGLTPTADKLRTLVDVSSVLGEEAIPRVSRALGQMAALGKLSAEELNQLSEVGINARKYLAEGFGMTVEELQKANVPIHAVIDTIWRGLDADYAGGAKKAMNSWNGLMVSFRKSVVDLERQIAAAGVFDALKDGLGYVNQGMSEWIKTNEVFLKQDLPKYIKEMVDGMKEFWEVVKLPSVTGTIFEAQDLIKKGLIDSQKFYQATFIERARMVEQAKQLAATDQMVGSRSGYKNAPGVAIPSGYRSGLAGTYTVSKAQLEEDEKAAKKAMDEYLKSSSGLTSYGAWEDDYAKLEALRLEIYKARNEAAQFDMDAYKKASEDDIRRLEKEIPFLQKEGLDERINDVVASVETGFDTMIKLSERTAEAMQSNFSDLFFDAMTGELKSFEDYFQAVARSIQRMVADIAAQMATEQLFGAGATGGKTGGGGLIGSAATWIGSLFETSGPEQLGQYSKGGVFGAGGVKRFAYGGVVDRPTVFPFARGVGLMGEAGPEAVIPLKRMADGRLGVSGGGGEIHVHNHYHSANGRFDRESVSAAQAGTFAALSRSSRRNN